MLQTVANGDNKLGCPSHETYFYCGLWTCLECPRSSFHLATKKKCNVECHLLHFSALSLDTILM